MAKRLTIEKTNENEYNDKRTKEERWRRKLKKEEISISEINESLKQIIHAKNSNEYKKLQSDIKKELNKIKLLNKESKIKSYIDLYNILNKKIDINHAPNIFLDSINNSFNNNESDLKELNYVCIKLEVKAGIESLKKDIEIRNQIQLELLSNKFNKSDKSNLDDVDSLIIHFINLSITLIIIIKL